MLSAALVQALIHHTYQYVSNMRSGTSRDLAEVQSNGPPFPRVEAATLVHRRRARTVRADPVGAANTRPGP